MMSPNKGPSAFLSLVMLALFCAPICAFIEPDPSPGENEQVEMSKDRLMGEIKADKALVYVVRPTFVGTVVKTYFFCDDEFIGINKGKSYFFFYVEPGSHVFWSKAENVDALELSVKAGETYFIKQGIQMGALKARIKLGILSESEGRQALEKCKKHTSPTAAGKAKGQEMAVKYKENTKEDLARRAEKAEKD